MHPNYCQITILLVVDLYSSLAYFVMTQPLPIAGKLPIKTLVAKQLPTNTHTHALNMDTHVHSCRIKYKYLTNRHKYTKSYNSSNAPQLLSDNYFVGS